MLVPMLLAGGAGSGLWPLSRELHPKQLLPIATDRTLLQDAAARLGGLDGVGRAVAVCGEHYRFLVAEQLRAIGASAEIVLEPSARNTAAAITAGALRVIERDGDALVLVLPTDHVLRDEAAFRAAVDRARPAALRGDLVLFGVSADHAEPMYGYLSPGDGEPWPVDRFVEKPTPAMARRLVDEGYRWNSGIYLFRASRLVDAMRAVAPELVRACEDALGAARRDPDFLRLDAGAWERCPPLSFEAALLERAEGGVVALPLDGGWRDVGSWSALWETREADARGNVLQGDVVAKDVDDVYVRAASRLVAVLGLRGVVVVETRDAVLVADKDRAEDVRALVDQLKASGRDEAQVHLRVARPWGAYECIDRDERFQVKRITVSPGASLSLQLHHKRAEHWVVVRGTARVTRGEDVFLLAENESTYIPLGTKHRLENPTDQPLEIIEVQSGSYLGEDDIVRFEDRYGR